MENFQKVTLEPTASMTLILGQRIYKNNEHITKYMERIDLSSGFQAAKNLNAVAHLAEEAMLNRKFFYHESIFNRIESNQYNSQIYILGVGYDPISVHILDTHSDAIENIVEIDISDFNKKKSIFEAINVPHLEKIKFVQANVITSNLIDIVRQYGYDDHKPSIITLEGLMYYMDERHFKGLLTSFKSPFKNNSFCVDYIFPHEEAPTEELRMIHKRSNEVVEKHANMKLTLYTKSKIVELVESIGGVNIEVSSQREIEFRRKGSNHAFKTEKEGGFEFMTFNI